MASLGPTPLLLDKFAGSDDLDKLAIYEADCSLSVVSSTIILRHEASVGLIQIETLISESNNSSRVDAREDGSMRRGGMGRSKAAPYEAPRFSCLNEPTVAPWLLWSSSPHPDSVDQDV